MPAFIETPNFQEAWQRMSYVLARREPLALVTGPGGCGKSTLLWKFAKELARGGSIPIEIATGQTFAEDLLTDVAAQLGCPLAGQRSVPQLWLAVKDQLNVYQLEQRQVVLLVDHAQDLSPEVTGVLQTIVRQQHQGSHELTTFLAVADEKVAQLDPQLRRLACLRIELEPWTADEVGQFLRSHFPAQAAGFSAQAIEALCRQTGGIARRVAALADLVHLATKEEPPGPIDPDLIHQVGDELLIPAGMK